MNQPQSAISSLDANKPVSQPKRGFVAVQHREIHGWNGPVQAVKDPEKISPFTLSSDWSQTCNSLFSYFFHKK